MLHLAPELVRLDVAEPGNVEPLADLLPKMMEAGVREVSPNGILGDPAGASAEEGAALLSNLIDDAAAQLVSFDR